MKDEELALSRAKGRKTNLAFEHALCDHCDSMDCVKACLNEALKIAGRYYTVEELMRILTRDQGFWGSQGGVTFSGGEPLFQPEFILAVLEHCRSAYIHTAVETSAHVDTDLLLQVLKWTDWLFIDLKHMDSAAHRAETGAGNELILRNIEAVTSAGWDGRLVIRVPIVPGYNDTVENLQATAGFVHRLHRPEVNILPFHRLGNSKYEQLGLEYKYAHVAPPSKETMLAVQRIFEAAGLRCYVDFETPF
jgi:pyruvate formate lyase activating enzyme